MLAVGSSGSVPVHPKDVLLGLNQAILKARVMFQSVSAVGIPKTLAT